MKDRRLHFEMQGWRFRRWFAVGLFWIILSACLTLSGTNRTTQETAAAESLEAEIRIAQQTIVAERTASLQLTELARSGTRTVPQKGTSPSSTPSQLPSETPITLPSPTSIPHSPTPSPPIIPCNQAIFMGDVSLPAGSPILVGSSFTKIWRLMNTGSCSWTTGYLLVYTGGNFPNPAPPVFLPAPVPGGGVVDLAVTMQAPSYPGEFRGFWMLQEPSGSLFGVNPNGSTPLELSIRTFQSDYTGGASYDLAVNYCSATWISGAGLLSCPGAASDRTGSVSLQQMPIFETQPRTGYGLLTRPDDSPNGTINGQFPLPNIRSGDVFLAEIGCLQNSSGCDLSFRLEYQTSNGQSGTLGTWRETYDGRTTQVEVNLSSLAGNMVWLNLKASNLGRWQAANAFWLLPRVQNGGSLNADVLTWSRTGEPQSDSCQELRIRMNGFNDGVAEAFSCETRTQQLGLRGLSSDEVNLIQGWLRRLNKVNSEVYYASQTNPIVIWIDFKGLGTNNATDADLRDINSFAADIYDSIAQ